MSITRPRRGSESGASSVAADIGSPESPALAAPVVGFTEQDIDVGLLSDYTTRAVNALRLGRRQRQLVQRHLPWAYAVCHALVFLVVVKSNTEFAAGQLFQHWAGQYLTALLLFCGFVHLHLANTDPGYIRTKREHCRGDAGVEGVVLTSSELEFRHAGRSKHIPSASAAPGYIRHCRYCCIGQPVRAVHCQYCNRCIYTYDHHCWWLNRCIGGRNKPLFLVFLTAHTALVTGTAALQLASLTESDGVLRTLLLLASFSVCAGVLQWDAQLLFVHVGLVLRNQTAIEHYRPDRCEWLSGVPRGARGGRGPFDKGVLRNLLDFLYYKPVEWEHPGNANGLRANVP